MSRNYTVYEVEKPSESFLKPNSIIGNVNGFIRGLTETPGREPQPSYNHLVTIYILIFITEFFQVYSISHRFYFTINRAY